MRRSFLFLSAILIAFSSCSIAQSLQKNAARELIEQPCLRHAYVGICIYDAAKKKYVCRHDADKYFTPASNTKLFTFYTGLNYIGDSTTGIQYQIVNDTLYIRGTGDPSLLHPDFPLQPAFEFLQKATLPIVFTNPVYENGIFGPGWSWDDYNADYQPERSAMPLYGNVARFSIQDHALHVIPEWFARNRTLHPNRAIRTRSFYVHREKDTNVFNYHVRATNSPRVQEVPFIVDNGKVTAALLQDTLHKPVFYEPGRSLPDSGWKTVHNVPSDSLFKHMLYRSDNFYAEQTDQMASLLLFDTISTSKVIRFMLQHEFKNLPDPPRWVDGSGLSRYNLFTPEDMVAVLKKLYGEFRPARIDSLLPTGGEGTLASLYHDMAGSVFAKTGSLSHDVSLSGYLITQNGHTLIFSILINHCICPLQEARIAMENFLRGVWKKY